MKGSAQVVVVLIFYFSALNRNSAYRRNPPIRGRLFYLASTISYNVFGINFLANFFPVPRTWIRQPRFPPYLSTADFYGIQIRRRFIVRRCLEHKR